MPTQPLRQAVTAVVDSNGTVRFDFPSTPQGLAWTGSAWTPDANPSALWTAYAGSPGAGSIVGTWPGTSGALLQARERETITIVGINLTPTAKLTCQWIGVSSEIKDAPDFYPSTYLSPQQIAVQPVQTTTSAHSTIGASGASQHLLEANASRIGATVYNDSPDNLFLFLGDNGDSGTFTLKMAPGGYFETPFGWSGIISGAWDGAPTGSAQVTEVT